MQLTETEWTFECLDSEDEIPAGMGRLAEGHLMRGENENRSEKAREGKGEVSGAGREKLREEVVPG